MFFVYILYSNNADKYYVGHTNNIDIRLVKHNSPVKFGEFTRKNGPWAPLFKTGFTNLKILYKPKPWIFNTLFENKSKEKPCLLVWAPVLL